MQTNLSSPAPNSLEITTLPNFITALRISVIPVLAYLLLQDNPSPRIHLIASLFFSCSLATDFLDGKIARRTQKVTLLGRLLDPLADKLVVMSGLVLLVYLQYLSASLAIVLLGREMAINSLRSFANAQGIFIKSSMVGRVKVFAQGFGIGFLMLGPGHPLWGLPWEIMGDICIYGAIVLSLWSAGEYVTRFIAQIKEINTQA